MRYLQIVLFIGAALSLYFIKSALGDVLWRAGMATLLFDIVCIMLWPVNAKGNTKSS